MSGNFTKRLGKFHKISVMAGGAIGVIAALLVRLLVGGPLTVVHKLSADQILPPLWLLGLLWLVWFFLLGAVAGLLLSTPCGGGRREALLWRGSTFLVLATVVSLVWYTLLFGKFSLFFSWLCLPVAMALALLCAFSWWRLLRVAGFLLVGYTLWLLCLFLLQFAVMLHN